MNDEKKHLLSSCTTDLDAALCAETEYREVAMRHLRADCAWLYDELLAIRRRLNMLQAEADRLMALYARARQRLASDLVHTERERETAKALSVDDTAPPSERRADAPAVLVA